MRRIPHRTILLGAVVAPLLGACRFPFAPIDRVCTAELRFGVVVRVTDSVTARPAASGSTLVIREGTYVDSMSIPAARPDLDELTFGGAGERAGTYTVTVTKSGYRPWTRTGVRVTKGECHVNQVQLEARLQPAPQG